MPSRSRIPSEMTPTSRLVTPADANGETLNFENARAVQALYVNDPQNLRKLEEKFGVKITTREGWIKLDGPAEGIAKARDVFQQLHLAREKGLYIRKNEFNFALESVAKNSDTKLPRPPRRAHPDFRQEAADHPEVTSAEKLRRGGQEA